MKNQKIVVDTDVLLEHLVHREGASCLRKAMNTFFCYTTVFNAIEAFSAARSEREIQAVDDAMSAMKVLGLNAKSAKAVGKIFSSVGKKKEERFAGSHRGGLQGKQTADCHDESKTILGHQTIAGDPGGNS